MLRSLLALFRSKTPPEAEPAAAPRPPQALISPEEFEALSARHAGEFDKEAYAQDLAQMVSAAMRTRMNS